MNFSVPVMLSQRLLGAVSAVVARKTGWVRERVKTSLWNTTTSPRSFEASYAQRVILLSDMRKKTSNGCEASSNI
jgi:hypothetical protein